MRTSFFSRIRAAAKTAAQTALVASTMAGAAHAQDIAINFQGDNYGNEFGRSVTSTAFGIAASDWFEDPSHTADMGDGGTSGATIDGVTFSWTFNNDWAQSAAFVAAGATGEDEAYFGYLDDGGNGADITISGLSGWLASNGASSYSVTLLMSSGQAASPSLLDTPLLDFSGGSTLGTFSVSTEPAHSGGGFGLQGSDTISDLTSDTLFVDGQSRAGNARGSIAGIIVSAVPEPSSGMLALGLGGIALLRRRRNG